MKKPKQNLKSLIFSLALSVIAIFSLSHSSFAGTPLSWQTTASTGCPAQVQSSTTNNGFVYLLTTSGTFFRYTPSTNIPDTSTCTALATFPTALNANSAISTVDSNRLLLTYGTSSLAYYYINENSWVQGGDRSKSKDPSQTAISQSGTTQGNGAIAIAKPGSNEIFIMAGSNSTNFQKYDFVANTWTPTSGGGSLAQLPVGAGSGSAITMVGNNIYFFPGNGSANFYSYNTAAAAPGGWTTLAGIPSINGLSQSANAGAAMTTYGGNIYAFIGGGKRYLLKYCIITDSEGCSTTGVWVTRANAPDIVHGGASLVTFGSNIYAFQGGGSRNFWIYNLATNTWNTPSTPPQAPDIINSGGSLTTDGTYIYATQGNNERNFWRFNPNAGAGPTWEELEISPVQVGAASFNTSKGAITFSNTSNSIYLVSGNGTTGAITIQNGGLIHRYDTALGTEPNTWVTFKYPVSFTGSGNLIGNTSVSGSDSVYFATNLNKTLLKFSKSNGIAIPWDFPFLPGNTSLMTYFQPFLHATSVLTGTGSSIVQLNGSFYIVGQSSNFFRYDITKNKYYKLADVPANFSSGALGVSLSAKDSNTLSLVVQNSYMEYRIDENVWLVGLDGIDDKNKLYKVNNGTSLGNGSSILSYNNELYFMVGGSTNQFLKYNLEHLWKL